MDKSQNFAEFIQRERDRLSGETKKIDEQIAGLTEQRTALDREMAAIAAYEAAREGKPVQTSGRGRTARGGKPQAARRGSKREELLTLIRTNPEGLARKDILEKLGLKGDKAGEMSVSNALTALTKNNSLARRDGKYVPAAA